MRDRPIIFSALMVRALLDGRKTQTRRLLNPQPELFEVDDYGTLCQAGLYHDAGAPYNRVSLSSEGAGVITLQRVNYVIGDRLYVREACAIDGSRVFYRLDHEEATARGPRVDVRWRPSIHMPRWASRITLTLTDVRLQPLLDISEEDAEAESFTSGKLDDGFTTTLSDGTVVDCPGTWASAAGHFQMLWSKLHPDWDGYSSPIVVALSFRVEHGNIDSLRSLAA